MNSEQAELELLRDQAPTAFEEAVRQQWPSVVKAKTNLTGGLEISANGEPLATSAHYDKPIFTIGGDHPYRQWFGTNGNDGLFQLFLDNGIKPYCAINWEASASASGSGGSFRDVTIGGSQTEMMSISEGLTMQSKGMEFTNHGTRHPNLWDQMNSGIRIDYNGTATPAKVFINGNGKNATEIKLQDADHVGTEITLTLSNYATLAELKAAIDAADGTEWVCEIAAELTGNEDPKWLWPIAAAGRTVTGGSVPYNNRRFCISGGVFAIYQGATYTNCSLHVESNGELKVFVDGVRAATSGTPGTQTIATELSSIRTTLGTFGMTVIPTATPSAAGDFYIDVMGNGKDSVGAAIRETYMQGDELGAYLTQGHDDCTGRATNITYGLPLTYIIERQVKRLIELSTAAGFTMRNFMQAGYRFPPHLIPHVPAVGEWRLDSSSFGFGNNSPMAMPACLDYQWHPMATALPTTGPQVKAIIDAAIDSGAWAIDLLLHTVTTGTFGKYTFPGFTGTPDIPATDMVDVLQYLGEKKASGVVDVVPPEQFRKLRRMRSKPKNLVFNPSFRNSEEHGGTALLNSTSNGATLPGWQCAFPSARFSAVSVDDGELSCAVSAGSAGYLLRQGLWMEPGKRYDVGFDIDAGALTAGNVYLGLRPTRMRPNGTLPASSVPSVTGKAVSAKSFSHMRMRVSPDVVRDWTPNRIASKTGTFDISGATAPRTANINIMGIGSVSVNFDDVTTLSAAKPSEIATRINAAIAGAAAYAQRGELHTIAKVVNNRVILELPFRNQEPLFSLITVTQVNSGLCAAIFGGAEVYSYGTPFGAFDAGVCQYMLDITLSADAAGTFTIRQPYCREVQSA